MPDSENWEILFEVYADHPETALHLAEELHIVIELLQQGKQGVPKAIAQIEEAINALYPHTDFDKFGRKFFQQKVAGKLKPKDETKLSELGVKIRN